MAYIVAFYYNVIVGLSFFFSFPAFSFSPSSFLMQTIPLLV